jgi:hypothetical protein
MAELTLITLLNFVVTDFCFSRTRGIDTLKSVLVAYSKANGKFGGSNVRRVILNSPGIDAALQSANVQINFKRGLYART